MATVFEPALTSLPVPSNRLAMVTSPTYQSLNQAAREIRLVQLFPASYRLQADRDKISCFTQVVPLDSCGQDLEHRYLALSYTWGDVSETTTVFLDNQEVQVTVNLADALEKYEHKDRVLTLWVDAICINQADDLEKTEQVGLMSEIFVRACGVLVWLGRGDDESAVGMKDLSSLGRAALRALRNRPSESFHESTAWGYVAAELRPRWFPGANPAFDLEAVLLILERPWFRRVWVLQEAALNRNVVVFCGQQTIKKSVLWAGAATAVFLSNEVLINGHYTHDSAVMWRALSGSNFLARRTLYLVASRKRRFSLQAVLSDISMNLGECAYEATDPRDRIFSVLGFASDCSELGIRPDYTKTCAHVYTEAAEAILTQSRSLDILYVVCGYKNILSLPSWVPDWSNPNASTFGPRRIGRFCAAGKLSVSDVCFSSDKNGNRLLSIAGHTVDHVHAILEVQWQPQWDLSAFSVDSNVLNFIQAYQEFGQTAVGNAYCSEDARQEALWRTPIADCDALLKAGVAVRPPASQAMRRSFEAFIKLNQTGHAQDTTQSRPFVHTMSLESARRRIFVTRKGYYGLGDESLKNGDKICVLFGGDSPFIIRQSNTGNHQLIGEAYVHGIMNGEYLNTRPPIESFVFC